MPGCVYSPGGSTFLFEINSWSPSGNYDIKSKIWLCQLMHIYVKNIPAKSWPDLILNHGASGFFEEVAPTRRTTTKRTRSVLSSNMRSVPDVKILSWQSTNTSRQRESVYIPWLIKVLCWLIHHCFNFVIFRRIHSHKIKGLYKQTQFTIVTVHTLFL